MTLVMLPPHVLGPKYERLQRPRNSQGFRIGRSRGNLARTPDVAVVISLNWFLAPVDDTVTAHKSQVTSSSQPGRQRCFDDGWWKRHLSCKLNFKIFCTAKSSKDLLKVAKMPETTREFLKIPLDVQKTTNQRFRGPFPEPKVAQTFRRRKSSTF